MTCEEMKKYECRSGTCVDLDRVCDYSDDCLDLSDERATQCSKYNSRCNFEDGLCDEWEQDADTNAKWVLLQASSDVIGTLPTYDHTLSTTKGNFSVLRNLVLQFSF